MKTTTLEGISDGLLASVGGRRKREGEREKERERGGNSSASERGAANPIWLEEG
jgi:hypothetical protein